MHRSRVLGLINAALLVWSGWLAVVAAPPSAAQLKVELDAQSPRGRAEAPRSFELSFRWRGPNILEGHLELDATGDDRVHYRYRSEVIAVPPGESTRTLVLPPFGTSRFGMRKLAGVFRGKDGRTFDVELKEAARDARGVRFCCALFRYGTVDRAMTRVFTALEVESVAPWKWAGGGPIFSQRDRNLRSATTNAVTRKISELPTLALDYCAFDVVIIDGRGIDRMREPARRALGQWIRAGGRAAFTLWSGGTLGKPAQAWLRELLGKHGASLNDDGTLPKTINARPGLGRVAFLSDTAIADDPVALRRMAAFVWDLRSHLRNGYAENAQFPRVNVPPDGDEEIDYQVQSHSFSPAEIEALVPVDAKPIPIWILGALLGGLLLWVGPGEFLIARFTRKGWLTWILFPVACAVATWWTMDIARRALGGVDFEAHTALIDVDAQGDVLRSTAFDFQFTASSGDVEKERRNELVSRRLLLAMTHSNSPTPLDLGTPRPLVVEGAYPRRYRTVERLEQWSPVMTRRFRIGDAGGCTLDIPDLVKKANRVLEDKAALEALREAVGSRPFGLWRYRGFQEEFTVVGEVPLAQSRRLRTIRTFAERTTFQPRHRGRLAVFASVSPSGGDSIESLGIVNSGSRKRLAVLGILDGPDVTVLRWRVDP